MVTSLLKPSRSRPAAVPGGRSSAPLAVRSFGLTDRGKIRPANEDQFLIAVLAPALRVRQTSLAQERWWYGEGRGQLFVVADGIAGQQGGEEASALAVSVVEQFLLNRLPRYFGPGMADGRGILADLREAFGRADATVRARAARHEALAGMGTTLTVAYSIGADLFLAHAGDSRCYLFRAGKLHRLTADHTVADWLSDHGLRPRRGTARSPARRVLTKVVGGPNPGVRPDLRRVRLHPGDGLLLCTDGLTDAVADSEIVSILARAPDPRRAAERLAARAARRGGKDNMTVVVARYGQGKSR